MLKRILLCLTAIGMICVLAACGNSSAADTSAPAAAASTEQRRPTGNQKVLVAYFSRAGENYGVGVVEKGNTQLVAEEIASQVGADLFRIQTERTYPSNYEEMTDVAREEIESNARPALKETLSNLSDYDVIYLGYPIWYGDMPMAVYTFLESGNFSGKTIIPFCTHAGSGLAGTVRNIRNVCPGANVQSGLAIPGTVAQKEPEQRKRLVVEWLGK